jgi:hypothetical protein
VLGNRTHAPRGRVPCSCMWSRRQRSVSPACEAIIQQWKTECTRRFELLAGQSGFSKWYILRRRPAKFEPHACMTYQPLALHWQSLALEFLAQHPTGPAAAAAGTATAQCPVEARAQACRGAGHAGQQPRGHTCGTRAARLSTEARAMPVVQQPARTALSD